MILHDVQRLSYFCFEREMDGDAQHAFVDSDANRSYLKNNL